MIYNWSVFIRLALLFELQYLNEASWNWRLMKTIMTMCHVYDKEQNYVAFDQLAPQDSQPIKFLKKVMPDYAWVSCVPCGVTAFFASFLSLILIFPSQDRYCYESHFFFTASPFHCTVLTKEFWLSRETITIQGSFLEIHWNRLVYIQENDILVFWTI